MCNLPALFRVIIVEGRLNLSEVMELTEAKALRLLQQGSAEALKWFISKYTSYVSTIIYNIIGTSMGSADVEEVASDVFFALWENAGKVNSGSVRGYLGAIARNKAKNQFRKAGFEVPLDEELYISEVLPLEGQQIENELQGLVRKKVLAMTEPDREILLRFYYFYQTIDDISAQMQINPSTVKTKLHRARHVLKKALANKLT